jgi:hypothetical protein
MVSVDKGEIDFLRTKDQLDLAYCLWRMGIRPKQMEVLGGPGKELIKGYPARRVGSAEFPSRKIDAHDRSVRRGSLSPKLKGSSSRRAYF